MLRACRLYNDAMSNVDAKEKKPLQETWLEILKTEEAIRFDLQTTRIAYPGEMCRSCLLRRGACLWLGRRSGSGIINSFLDIGDARHGVWKES
jgi:hypothetical protein